MSWILLLLTYLVSFGFTSGAIDKDILTDELQEAALRVIAMHSRPPADHRFDQYPDDDNRTERSLNGHFPQIPVLDNSSLSLVADPEFASSQKITELMFYFKDRFVDQQTYLQKLRDALKYAIRTHSNKLVVDTYLIRNLTALRGTTVSRVKSLIRVFWQNSRLSTNDLKFKVKDLQNSVNGIKGQVARIMATISDLVLRNIPAKITGHKRFGGHFRVGQLSTTSAVIGSVGRQDMRQVMKDIYRRRRSQQIRGTKRVLNNLFVSGFITSGIVNGIDINKQIVTTNQTQVIKSRVHFESQLSVVNHMAIRGRINHLDVNKDLVFLDSPQLVMAPKIFTTPPLITQSISCETIDGINLEHLLRNVLTSSGVQSVANKLILMRPIVTKDITVSGMFDDIDIGLMATQLVYKNRPVLVKGRKSFVLDDIHIRNHLLVGKQIDGQYIPHTLLLRSRNQVIVGQKIFNGVTRFEGNVLVNGYVDGLRLPQEIVTLTRNETIVGPILFGQSVVAKKDIDARRLVDGVDLSQLRLYSLKLNDRVIPTDARFRFPVSVGLINVFGSVNGQNLKDLFANAIFRGSPNPVLITGSKSFDSHIQVNQLSTEFVNGFRINDFMTTNKNENIIKDKIFAGLTDINKLKIIKGRFSGVNVTDLDIFRISLSEPQKIIGIKNFVNPLVIEKGFFTHTINGLNPNNDFVLKNMAQNIKGAKIFLRPLNTKKIIMKPNTKTTVGNHVNGVHLNSLSSKAIRLNDHKYYPLNIFLVNSNSTDLEVSTDLNGFNFNWFAQNVMSLTKPQNVSAAKVFRKEQTFATIQSFKGISGIRLPDLRRNAVYLNRYSYITKKFTFTHPVVFERPIVLRGRVNAIDLTTLAKDAVFKTGRARQVIYGQNVFRSGFEVNGNVNCFTVNGMQLPNQLLTTTRDHFIRAKVIFSKTLHINGDTVLNGYINGIKLSALNRRVLKTNDRNVVYGNLELFGLTRTKYLNTRGLLNGVNLTTMLFDAIFLDDSQALGGTKSIVGPIRLLRHLNTTNLNNFNVPQLLKDIVFVNSPNEQHIFSPKVFVNDIISHGLIQSKGISQMGSINGIDLAQLNFESLKTNIPSIVKMNRNFKDFVLITGKFTEIMGRINGINLSSDVIHLRPYGNSPQVITGTKTFAHLRLNDITQIDGLVNGFSLKDIEENTLLIVNNQRMSGYIRAKGFVAMSADNNFVAKLNGLLFPQDFIRLDGTQTMFDDIAFRQPILVTRNLFVKGLVNGLNLTKLATESLLKDKAQVLAHPLRFETLVFRQDVMVDRHVNNIDLSALSTTVQKFTHAANITKDMLISKANRHHYISDYLYHTLERSVFGIDSFTLYQSLDEIHGNHIEVLADGMLTIHESIETPKTVQSIRFNPKTQIFDVSHVDTNPLVVRNSFVLNGQEFSVSLSPFSHNSSAHISKSGQSLATIGTSVSSVEVLKFAHSDNRVILVSFQALLGKVLVHSFEILPKNKFVFKLVTAENVGTDTSKVIAFVNSGQVHVVVAKRIGLKCAFDPSATLILVLRNDGKLEPIQRLPIVNVMDAIHFENNGKHYLALSDGTSVETSLSPQTIYVYRSEVMSSECRFALFQNLYFDNTIQLSTFTYGTKYSPNQYLMAANASDVSIWRQKGESGFTDNWVLSTKKARVISPFISSNNLYLIVGQSYKCHESLIFRAQTRGIALAPIVFTAKQSSI